jgi:hypothetical protein
MTQTRHRVLRVSSQTLELQVTGSVKCKALYIDIKGYALYRH